MYQRILVPVDGSPTSERGLDEAIRLARLTGGRLRLMHVVDELSLAMANGGGFSMARPDMFQLLRDGGAQILAQAQARVEAASLPVDTLLDDTLGGRVAELVVAQARQWPAELIVIGTHGRRGVGRLVMGSGAEQILRLAPVPVLLVRAAEARPADD
jgi:nucleotide-binding universal stress UspA family protein